MKSVHVKLLIEAGSQLARDRRFTSAVVMAGMGRRSHPARHLEEEGDGLTGHPAFIEKYL